VEMDFPGLTVGSLYLPSGDVGTARQEEKERFMTQFLAHLTTLRKESAAAGREVLICGDWNIAHQEIDLKNWKANQTQAGFLPEERAWLTRVLDEAGYTDVLRRLHPQGPGPYTWWSNRGQAFTNDTGWRIDYQMATAGLASRATSALVERAATYTERWSDHAPVTCTFDWDNAAMPTPRSPIEGISAQA
jgi:exodeoxyribonuclease III